MPTQTMEVDVTVWKAVDAKLRSIECDAAFADRVTCHVKVDIEPAPVPEPDGSGLMAGMVTVVLLAKWGAPWARYRQHSFEVTP